MASCRTLGRLAICLLLLPSLYGQSTPDELLRRVRNDITDSVVRSPNYTCTETVSRTTYSPIAPSGLACNSHETPDSELRLTSKDRLRLDVGVSGLDEIFSWHGEKSFNESDIARLVGYGSIGSGMFSSFLGAIFGKPGARFRFDRQYNQGGRDVAVFSYIMPREMSTWAISDRSSNATVGFQGRFVVDPETANLRALSIESIDLFRFVSSYCAIRLSTEYHQVQLGSSMFVLPLRVKTVMLARGGAKTEEETEYSSCHQFVGESTLHFEVPDSPTTPAAAPKQEVDLPSGLTLRLRLASTIDPDSSYVGDPVEALLEEPLRGANHEMLAPKRARVLGRLVRLQSVEQPARRLEVAFDWQQVDAGATVYRIAAHRQGATDPDSKHLFDSPVSVHEEVPSQTFFLKGDHPKVDASFVSRWITEKPRPRSKL
jgi:hypothetical protein